jgi:hypothetical protein
MGISKILGKKINKRHILAVVRYAYAQMKDALSRPEEDIEKFTRMMITKIEMDHPLYKYERFVFDFDAKGNINFKFIMRLRQ